MDREYTTVTVAHRLSTAENADRVDTLEDGRVSEIGTHDELLEQDGEHADPYAMQRR